MTVGPKETWDMLSMFDDLLLKIPAGDDSNPGIELSGMFFGSAPALMLPPDRVERLARIGASLDVALRTTDYGVIGNSRTVGQALEPTTLKVSFRVKGLFEPADFTQRVGIQPTTSSRRQQPRKVMARVSTWRLEIGPFPGTLFPTLATDELLRILSPHVAEIQAAVRETGTRSAVHYSAVYGTAVPRLKVSADELVRIAGLGCWLDFSILVVRESGDMVEF